MLPSLLWTYMTYNRKWNITSLMLSIFEIHEPSGTTSISLAPWKSYGIIFQIMNQALSFFITNIWDESLFWKVTLYELQKFSNKSVCFWTVQTIFKSLQIKNLVPSQISQPVCNCVRDFTETFYRNGIESFFGAMLFSVRALLQKLAWLVFILVAWSSSVNF